MDKKISIIVPCYNAEKTIKRCIDSLLKQTYTNIEIIIVNDGSTDGTKEICEYYAGVDSRIKFISKDNGGVSSARNIGLDNAVGFFVMFCDSDDWAEENWCEELVSNYQPECLIMCGNYIEGMQTYLPYEVKANKEKDIYERSAFYQLRMKCFNVPWNKIYLRSIIEQEKIRFAPLLSNGEDYLFNLEYLNCISGKIIVLNKCVFHYNWPNGVSLSNTIPKNYFEQLDFLCIQLNKQIEKLSFVANKDRVGIYTDLFFEYQRGVAFILKNRKLSFLEKKQYVKTVMCTKSCQECVEHANISLNKIYTYLWKHNWVWGIILWHELYS